MRKQTPLATGVVKRFANPTGVLSEGMPRFTVTGAASPINLRSNRAEMRRFFRLAQAFDLRQLRCLEPGTTVVFGWDDTTQVVKELKELRQLVNHLPTRKRIDELCAAISVASEDGQAVVTAITGE